MTRAAAGWGFLPGTKLEDVIVTPRARVPSQPRRSRAPQIAYWLGACRDVPSVGEIVDTWHVSRAMAYRWHAFAETRGTSFLSPTQGTRA